MFEKLLLVSVLILNCPGLLAAETWRWEDSDGKIYYSDTPPPADARNAERADIVDNGALSESLPYELQQAVDEFPVILYITSTDCGEPCDIAQNYLIDRGIPHTLLDATKREVQEALNALPEGRLEVPVAQIGDAVLWGFQEQEWSAALDEAGYPEEAMISVTPQIPVDDSVDQGEGSLDGDDADEFEEDVDYEDDDFDTDDDDADDVSDGDEESDFEDEQ